MGVWVVHGLLLFAKLFIRGSSLTVNKGQGFVIVIVIVIGFGFGSG